LSDEKGQFAARCSALEAEKGKLLAEAAESRAHNKTLSFELANVKESLERLRTENEELRRERSELAKASREAVLAEDCKRLGLSLKSEALAAVVTADEAVFQAFRKTLGEIRRAPAEPPAGAFESLIQTTEENAFAAPPSLADKARARRDAGKEAPSV
jgi:chromosome segregation ATPase